MRDTHDPSSSGEEIAELLVHLGRAARGEEGPSLLTPAQWTALRYLARANAASCTPSAFASFHATTRGTATQTLKALEAKGLIARQAAPTDGRSVRFTLTDTGRQSLVHDPLRDLAAAIRHLPDDLRTALCSALPKVVDELASLRGAASFGTCRDCRHFADDASGASGGAYCACMAQSLAAGALDLLCVNFAMTPPDLRADRTR